MQSWQELILDIANESENELINGLVVICYHPGLRFPVRFFSSVGGRIYCQQSKTRNGQGSINVPGFGTLSHCDTVQLQELVVLGIPLWFVSRVVVLPMRVIQLL